MRAGNRARARSAIGLYLNAARHWPKSEAPLLILGALALLQFLLIACSFILAPVLAMNTGSDGTAIYGRS